MIALLVGLAHAATWRVAADGSGDFTSIQAALDAAADGDTVQVEDGTYDEGTVVPVPGYPVNNGTLLHFTRSVTLIGESVDGVVVRWNATPAQQRMDAILFADGDYDATIDGLTFVHDRPGTDPGNYAYAAVQYAQGASYTALVGTFEVRNAVFRMPAAHAKSVAYWNSIYADFTLSHLTVDFGTTTAGDFAYVNNSPWSNGLLIDSILMNASCGWNREGNAGVGPQFPVQTTDTWGCTPPAGAGNVDVDPLVVDRSGGDYRLQAGSPVADLAAGPPPLDPFGGPADLGAHGATRPAAAALDWGNPPAVRVTNAMATLAFEDLATSSDEDLNDLVLRHRTACRVDAGDGVLLDQRVHFASVAAGAQKPNRLRLRPLAVPDRVAWEVDGGGSLEICGPSTSPCGTEIALYDDFDAAFPGATATFVNTVPGAPVIPGRSHALRLEWGAGPAVGGACPDADFVLARPEDGVVVDDTSTLPDGVPLAGRFPGDWAVPAETIGLGTAYPDLLAWLAEAVVGCPCAHDDWYASPGPAVIARADLSTTAPVPPTPTCDDDVQNDDEAGIDCGGTVCPECP